MTDRPTSTAVAVFVYRRPQLLQVAFERVRRARPRRLFVIADVPPAALGGADDAEHRAALDVARRVDWPCDVVWEVAASHLGCGRRMRSGLDLVFDAVDRAIVVEDDVVLEPSFFPWCEAMLDRYADVTDVMHVSGRNELVVWPASGLDHLIARRGSIWGWATWRRAWRHSRSRDGTWPSTGDPLLDTHLQVLGIDDPDGARVEWDVRWTLDVARRGGLSVVPPVNLVANIGFGPHATHTVTADDLRGSLPTLAAAPPDGTLRRPVGDVDGEYDHRALLVELMASYRSPAHAAHLARLAHRNAAAVAPDVHHHLAPFREQAVARDVLTHLRLQGVPAHHVDPLVEAIERGARP